MVRSLLNHHAGPNLKAGRLTPLRLAVDKGNTQIAKLLLEANADPSVEFPLFTVARNTNPQSAEMALLLLQYGAKPNALDVNGESALAYAVNAGNVDVVRMLITHGADVNLLNKQGRPPLSDLRAPLSDTGREIQAMLIQSGADPDYNRRRGIWLGDSAGAPGTMVFPCPSNSVNRYTLFEFLATEYWLANYNWGNAGDGFASPGPHFPDFTRLAIHRLEGKSGAILHVTLAQLGDCSQNMALQAGDVIEIPEQEHRAFDQWRGLSDEQVTNLNTCLFRAVRMVVKGTTNTIALVASPALTDMPRRPFAPGRPGQSPNSTTPTRADWLVKALQGRTADIVLGSFKLDAVVQQSHLLLNTSDLSRVRLHRGTEKMSFNLTPNSPPNVWLEDGDLIEVPEIGESAE